MTESACVGATVVVTGGNGRVGRLLVERLRADGVRTVSLARSRADAGHPDDVLVDLTDMRNVRDVILNADASVVVHLASVLRGPDVLETNERIDKCVAFAVDEAEIEHVVLASSGSVYGTVATESRTEASALDGDSPYAISKKRTEDIFRAVATRNGAASLATLRIFNLSGPCFPDSLVQRLIRADLNRPVTLIGADTFVRDYMYQGDLIKVLREAVNRRFSGESIVNVGAGVPVSTRQLLERLRVDPSFFIEVEGAPTSSWTDNSKMIDLFGVVPRAMPDRSWDLRSA
ncbi:NAD-dependent epimerase/dehydratase family protein [Microbacterium aerolatum]|uniref:Ketoreductase domain-containing protein n=1 Tax=Microbacterium aerolatum TaxID=153731 RepID=A0A511ADK9_9MICO|nr:SDR family oxidoreductase [Microbacterium aerolatum]GEK86220.1 hypothetical protein MAE01_13960 [Microbacterium aerolatum]GGB16233.1 hypothetical protein GCM10007198_03500 [Microbacterium aerolatum]